MLLEAAAFNWIELNHAKETSAWRQPKTANNRISWPFGIDFIINNDMS